MLDVLQTERPARLSRKNIPKQAKMKHRPLIDTTKKIQEGKERTLHFHFTFFPPRTFYFKKTMRE